jgi:hypothetical protein
VADRAVGVGLADAVALLAAAGHRGAAFELHKRMRRAARSAGLIGLREIHLLGREARFAVDGGPGGGGVPAMEELLVDAFVTRAAISGGEFGRDGEAVMVLLFLLGGGLVELRQLMPLAACRLISYSWTTEYCVRA